MRARMTALEEELAAARQRTAAAEASSADRAALAERVAALEAELAKLRATPPPEPSPLADGAPPTSFEPPTPRPKKEESSFMRRYRAAAQWFGVIAAIVVAGIYLVDLDWCGTDLEGAPSAGVIEVGSSPVTRSGRVAAEVRAEELFHPRCRGWLPEAPFAVLSLDRAAVVTARASSREDTVMVLRLEDGDFECDDESGGHNDPQIVTELPAGEHRVWVGPHDEGAEADVELTVTAQP